MAVLAFPKTRRVSIDSPADHAEVEAVVSALAGLVTAMGGAAALGGRELFALSPRARAELLAGMCENGEVVFGWREPDQGRVSNVAIEKLIVTRGEVKAPAWRAELFVEEEEGHVLKGALVEPTLDEAARRLAAAATGAPASLHRTPQAALAAFATRCV